MQVGRLPTCDIPLEHLSVSRAHAQFTTDGAGNLFLTDLGSGVHVRRIGRAAGQPSVERCLLCTPGLCKRARHASPDPCAHAGIVEVMPFVLGYLMPKMFIFCLPTCSARHQLGRRVDQAKGPLQSAVWQLAVGSSVVLHGSLPYVVLSLPGRLLCLAAAYITSWHLHL